MAHSVRVSGYQHGFSSCRFRHQLFQHFLSLFLQFLISCTSILMRHMCRRRKRERLRRRGGGRGKDIACSRGRRGSALELFGIGFVVSAGINGVTSWKTEKNSIMTTTLFEIMTNVYMHLSLLQCLLQLTCCKYHLFSIIHLVCKLPLVLG